MAASLPIWSGRRVCQPLRKKPTEEEIQKTLNCKGKSKRQKKR